ncbi:MAG: hypothetical protein U0359_37025 [Byssovorax sp.]
MPPRWFLPLLLLSGSGCGLLLGTDDFAVDTEAPAPVGPYGGALDWLPASCADCASAACDASVTACIDDSACDALLACATAAKDPGQIALCAAKYAAGGVLLGMAQTCMMDKCSAACVSDHRWDCGAAAFTWPPPIASSFTFKARVTQIFPPDPLPGLLVKACPREGWKDPSCAHVMAQSTTDKDGIFVLHDITFQTLTTIEAWNGWLDISGPGLYPELRYWSWPTLADRDETMSSITQEALAGYAKAYGLTQDDDRGLVTADVQDCYGFRAPGVAIEVDAADDKSVRLYSKGDLTFDAKADVTSRDGVAVFVNVPAGITVLRAKEPSGKQVACAEILVRAGGRSGVGLRPLPAGACK